MLQAQVCGFLEAALRAGPLCLPSLEHIGLYLDERDIEPFQYRQPHFHVDDPPAPEWGAQGACNALGKLVALGALPELREARCPPSCPHCHPPSAAGDTSPARPSCMHISSYHRDAPAAGDTAPVQA